MSCASFDHVMNTRKHIAQHVHDHGRPIEMCRLSVCASPTILWKDMNQAKGRERDKAK